MSNSFINDQTLKMRFGRFLTKFCFYAILYTQGTELQTAPEKYRKDSPSFFLCAEKSARGKIKL